MLLVGSWLRAEAPVSEGRKPSNYIWCYGRSLTKVLTQLWSPTRQLLETRCCTVCSLPIQHPSLGRTPHTSRTSCLLEKLLEELVAFIPRAATWPGGIPARNGDENEHMSLVDTQMFPLYSTVCGHDLPHAGWITEKTLIKDFPPVVARITRLQWQIEAEQGAAVVYFQHVPGQLLDRTNIFSSKKWFSATAMLHL